MNRYFIDTLEDWRKAMHVDKMILCGHSIGGYLSVAYAGPFLSPRRSVCVRERERRESREGCVRESRESRRAERVEE